MAGSEGMGVADYPMHPSGDFPLECGPDVTKLGCKAEVKDSGLDEQNSVPISLILIQGRFCFSQIVPTHPSMK